MAPLYVVYSRQLATANQTNDAVASLADQTYSNQLAQHQASFVATTAPADATRQRADAAANADLNVAAALNAGRQQTAAQQAQAALDKTLAASKSFYALADARAEQTFATYDAMAAQSLANARATAEAVYQKGLFDLGSSSGNSQYQNQLAALQLTRSNSLAAADLQSITTHQQNTADRSRSLSAAALELLAEQIPARDDWTAAQTAAAAAMSSADAQAEQTWANATTDHARTFEDLSTDAIAAQDKANTQSGVDADHLTSLADQVWSFQTAGATSVLWQAEAGSEQTVLAARAASAVTAQAPYSQLMTYLADRAGALSTWSVSHGAQYVTYQTQLAANVQMESDLESAADRTDSNALADAEAAETKGMSAATAARMHALAGVEATATMDVDVPNADYQVRLQKAAGQYALAQARAQNALQLGGSAADFTAAMQAAQYARTLAEQAATSDYALADMLVESDQRLTAADANRDFELAVAGTTLTRQTTESLADRNDAVTISGAAHDLAISTAVLDREFALFEASGLDSTLAVLAAAHPSAWAHEQSLTVHAAAVKKAATAVAFASQQIASVNSGLAYDVSTADIKLAFDAAIANATADAETGHAMDAHVNAVAQIDSDTTLAMLGAMPLHPQSIVPPPIVSAASVTTYSPLPIATPDSVDPIYSNLIAGLFHTGPTPNSNAPEELQLPKLIKPTPNSAAPSAQEPNWLLSTSGAHLTNARTTLGSAEVSVVGAFFAGLTAGGYSVLDAYTPDFLVDVQEAKAKAWEDAGLKNSWAQAVSEGAASISREAAISVATAGLGNLAGASRVAAGTLAATRTALVGRDIYEGSQDIAAAYNSFKDGNVWGGLYHSALAGLNVAGAVGGIRQLGKDLGTAIRTVSVPRTTGAGEFLDPRSVSEFPLSQRIDLQLKHQTQIRLLQQGDVLAPAGTVSRQLLGDLTVATGREVGLIRVGNQRVLRLGGPSSINLADAKRVIAHTHPSGDLRLSGRLGGQTGDIPAFREFQPRQRSSILVGPDGRAIRLPIPR